MNCKNTDLEEYTKKAQNYAAVKKDVLYKAKKELDPTAKILYVAIVILTGKRTYIKISRSTLGEYIGIKPSTISKYLKILKDKKLLEIKRDWDNVSTYSPVKLKDGERFTSILRSFILYSTFTHTQKIFFISVANYWIKVDSEMSDEAIFMTYKQIAEKTGLSERFVAETVRSLQSVKSLYSDDNYAVLERKGNGIYLNKDNVIALSVDEHIVIRQQRDAY